MFVLLVVSLLSLSLAESSHELRDKHEKEDKSPEEQAEYDKEVLFGGEQDEESLNEMTDEEQREKLRNYIENKVDSNNDGYVSHEELLNHTLHSLEELQDQELKEEHSNLDTDKDGTISWEEYAKSELNEDKDASDKDKSKFQVLVENDKKMFAAADKDGDGKLSFEELNAFRHPQTDEATKKVLIEKVLTDNDKNQDGVIDEEEFLAPLNLEEQSQEDKEEILKSEKQRFTEELDADKSGTLSGDELLSINGISDNKKRAKDETDHLIKSSDENEDGHLTVAEIINNHELWISNDEPNEEEDHSERSHYEDEL